LGIEVVSASGSLAPNNFVLKNGPIDTGLFDYNLYLADPNDWVLASAPNRTFFELPSLMSAAQSMWQQASGVWLDRTADLRASLAQPCVYEGLKESRDGCPAAARAGAWVKVLGATESRSPTHSFSLFDTKQTYATDYDQSGGGVVAGFDVVRHADDGRGVWLAGIMGGYLRSVVDFENSATNADFEGGAVGGYVTYLRGPWFLDAKLMANIGSVDYSGSHAVEADANVTSIGGVLDTGYRIDRGRYFIEPGATLSYVGTDIDNLAVYGTSVNFANGDSLRGRLGVRLGTTFQDQRAKYEPFLGLSAWYEFLGDNSISLVSNGYALGATDDAGGAIGEVSGGVNVYSLAGDGVSGFLKGNLEFGNDDYLGFAGSFGVRVDW
jgi:outer membrane autotransporter protein